MKKQFKKLLSILMVFAMLIGMVSTQAFAAEDYTWDSGAGILTVNTDAGITAWETAVSATEIKTVVVKNTVATIAGKVFQGLSNLESLTFEGDVTIQNGIVDSVYYYPFSETTKLAEITFGGKVNIGDGVFLYSGSAPNTALKTLSFPAGSTFGSAVFSYCTALKKLSFPAGSTFGSAVFNYCTALEEITFNGDADVTSGGCFASLPALKKVDFKGESNLKSGAFGASTNLEEINFGGKTRIGSGVFTYSESAPNTALKKLSFPAGSTFGSAVFSYCTALEEIVFNGYADVTSGGCFGNLTALKKIDFKGESNLKSAAFAASTNLEEINFGGKTSISSGAFTYSESAPNTALKTLSFPAGSTFGSAVFSHCTALEEIVFNGDADVTAGSCFANLTALKKIDFKGESKLSSGAFGASTNLEEINFGGKTSIGSGMFTYSDSAPNTALKSLSFPAGSTFSSGIFNGCNALKELVFEGNVDLTAGGSIYNTPALERVEFKGESKLANGTLSNSVKLKTLIFGGKTDIGANVFIDAGSQQSSGMDSIVVPAGSTIGEKAFKGANITTIEFKDTTPPEFGVNAFAECPQSGIIYVPAESYDAYVAALNGDGSSTDVANPVPLQIMAPTLYNVWVAGTQVTSANAADVLGDGAASYDAGTNTLTVSKDITATATDADAIKATTTDDFNVNVADGVTLSAADGSGIYVDYGSVNLTVDGDVTIDAGVYGIYGYEDITIDCADLTITSDLYAGIYAGDGSVDLTAGNVTISAVNDSGIAAYGSAKLTVDGDVTIDAAVYGIYGYEDVTIDCADLTITGVNYGIDADYGSVNLKAEDVTIEADDFAIYGYEDVTIDCADLTITSSNFGIYADFGDVGLKAEDVTIEAVVAIYGCENVTVDCGKFDAIAYDGIYADGSVNLKAGDVAIEADDFAIYGYEDITIDCDTANIIGVYGGIVAPGCSIIIEKGNFDIQSTEAGEYDASYHALYFGEDFTYPAGATVTAATEPNGTFVPYVEENNDTYDHVKITVPASVQPTVALNKSAITLTVDGTETLVPTITPADLPNYALSWTSDDESVATVDVDGTVTAVAPGTATITVTLMPGAMPRSEEDPVLPTATCVVTVVEEDVPQEPTTSVTVTKVWNVPETFDRADLPESVRVAIYANGEKLLENVLSERNEWTWTKELPAATEDGTPIVYTVDELEVPDGYEKTIGEAVETDTGIEITITNTLVEEDDKENEEGGNGGATTPTTPSAPSTPSVPDTGDNTNTLGWMTTMAASAAALIALVIYRRKRRAE